MLQSEAFYRLRVSLLQPSLFKGHERWSLKIHSCLGRTLEQRVCVCVDVCLWNDVWKCQTLWRCRRSSCGSSSTPSRIFSRIFVVVVLKPQVRTSTSLYKHFVIPLLTTEFAVYGYGRNEKRQNTWCEDATWTLLTQKKKTSKSERTFSPVLSYSVWLALFWSEQKRCEGAPWRFSVGMTSLQCTSCSRGQPQKSWTRGLKKKRKKEKGLLYWPNVLLPSSLCWETGTIIFWVFHDLMTHVEKWNGLN